MGEALLLDPRGSYNLDGNLIGSGALVLSGDSESRKISLRSQQEYREQTIPVLPKIFNLIPRVIRQLSEFVRAYLNEFSARTLSLCGVIS